MSLASVLRSGSRDHAIEIYDMRLRGEDFQALRETTRLPHEISRVLAFRSVDRDAEYTKPLGLGQRANGARGGLCPYLDRASEE